MLYRFFFEKKNRFNVYFETVLMICVLIIIYFLKKKFTENALVLRVKKLFVININSCSFEIIN